MAYKIRLERVDNGQKVADGEILADGNGVPTAPKVVILKASDTQIKAVLDYMGQINAGTDTSAVETAVNAL